MKIARVDYDITLQQYLPFTVLKLFNKPILLISMYRCNSTYRLRYWNDSIGNESDLLLVLQQYLPFTVLKQRSKRDLKRSKRCNSTYRLRYWNDQYLIE